MELRRGDEPLGVLAMRDCPLAPCGADRHARCTSQHRVLAQSARELLGGVGVELADATQEGASEAVAQRERIVLAVDVVELRQRLHARHDPQPLLPALRRRINDVVQLLQGIEFVTHQVHAAVRIFQHRQDARAGDVDPA